MESGPAGDRSGVARCPGWAVSVEGAYESDDLFLVDGHGRDGHGGGAGDEGDGGDGGVAYQGGDGVAGGWVPVLHNQVVAALGVLVEEGGEERGGADGAVDQAIEGRGGAGCVL